MNYRSIVSSILFLSVFSVFHAQDTLKLTYYNLLDFPHLQQDRIDTLKKILDFIQPDIFVVNELTSFNGGALIKNNALNVNGVTDFASAVFYDGPDTDNLLFYDQTKLGLHSQYQIQTTLRDISEYVLYYKAPDLSTTLDTTYLYFYSLHLKAGSDPVNVDRRDQDAEILKQYLVDNNRINRIFVGGDFNFYNHTEQGCQEILNGQGLTLFDPINRMGNWHNNIGYKNYHTQSTRSSTGGYAGGASGGMDDRFDFIFVSNDVMNASGGVKYIENSYIAEGQDGGHYNLAINSSANTSVPPDIANALFYMSDHLPISLEFTLGGTVGLNSSNAKELNILYFSDDKLLQVENLKEVGSIRIFDIRGKCVLVKQTKGHGSTLINVAHLNTGFYIMSFVLENRLINYKFVIN